MDVLLLVYSSLFCGMWILLYFSLVFLFAKIPIFKNLVATYPDPCPKMSVIVPACNEEEHIEQTTRSLIAQEYPGLEIILVNDRSNDKTGEIIDRLAAECPQVKPIHIKQLPDNWLGKVYAPVNGELIEGNEALEADPSLINQDCYGQGWMLKIKPADPDEVNNLIHAPSDIETWVLEDIEKYKQD